ncbi:MAG: DegT/DnrJ/EryC1/StrS family aminotransferase [Spirochaetaceae bacterium]|nr:MAG: DegT/DnrJ/EryC1/StrS family aminotransferase [Spirochaetaceae bacterium]
MEKLAILGGKKSINCVYGKDWPPIDDIDRSYVLASLEGENHKWGPNCVAFEKEFAAWNGNEYAITTNSGTAALHMAVAACECGVGDEIIVPAYSWSSSATCVIHHNAIPKFVDVDFYSMNIDVNKIEDAITSKTKAIIVVHLHGNPVNMDKVIEIARKYNLRVIEDACQAHGAKYKNKKVGRWGDCAAFSTNQNKCLVSGEGGLFVTDDEEIYKRALQLWSFGEIRTPMENRDFHAYALGWMYRNNDLTAAFGRAQLTKLDHYIEVQRQNAQVLIEELKDIKALILPLEEDDHYHNYYNFTCKIDMDHLGYKKNHDQVRNTIVKALQEEGAPVSMYQVFILPAMTVFRAQNAYGKGCPWSCPHQQEIKYEPERYPVAQKYCDTHFGTVWPLRAPNGEEAARAVAGAIKKVFANLDQLDFSKEWELEDYESRETLLKL